MYKLHQYLIMFPPTMGQFAALEAFQNSEDAVDEMRSTYSLRRRMIVDGMNGLGLTCFEPRGAFYAFPEVSISGMNDEVFCERLLPEERVAVIPGRAFGSSGNGFIPASYATSEANIETALERMARFMQRHG